jgi:hypothetical protein
MAVKVMVAPAIARGEIGKPSKKQRAPAGAAPPQKPKRRRSSVYDADGNEVFITLMCLKCHKMRPLSQFGLRRMADGAIRNQPWCRTCRSAPGPEQPPRGRAAGSEVAAGAMKAPGTAASPDPIPTPAPEPRASPSLAAEVAAALAAGMRR